MTRTGSWSPFTAETDDIPKAGADGRYIGTIELAEENQALAALDKVARVVKVQPAELLEEP